MHSTLRETEIKYWIKTLPLLFFFKLPDLQKALKSDLSKLEWAPINHLKNGKKIEIKESDKGRSVVILSKSHYKSIILHYLMVKRPTKIQLKSRPGNNEKNKSFKNKV